MTGSPIFPEQNQEQSQNHRQHSPGEQENRTTHQEHSLRATVIPRELQADCIQAVSSREKATCYQQIIIVLRILLQLYFLQERRYLRYLLLNSVGYYVLSYIKKCICLYNTFPTLPQLLLSNFVTYAIPSSGFRNRIRISIKSVALSSPMFSPLPSQTVSIYANTRKSNLKLSYPADSCKDLTRRQRWP